MQVLHGRLVGLELRRALTGGTGVVALGLALVLCLVDWTPDVLGTDGRDLSTLSRALRRQAAWSGTLLFLVPALTLHAGHVFHRWRSGEADWLGSRPTGRLAALASSWTGTVAAGIVLLAGVALVIEGSSTGGHDAPELAWSHDLDDFVRLEPGEQLVIRLALPASVPAGSELAVRLRPSVGAAPTTDVSLAAVRDGQTVRAAARLSTRTSLALPTPAGSGPAELSISNDGAGALAVIAPSSFELWVPGGGEWRISMRLVQDAALAVATLAALAMAFSAWMGAMTASIGALTSWIAAVGLAGAPSWYPGAGLPDALARVAATQLPERIPALAIVVAALVVGAALGGATAGLRSWRYAE